MKQKLTSDSIYSKTFNIDFKGYNALEVDQLLDVIIEDYEFFESVIKEQRQLLERYEKTLTEQKNLLVEYEGRTRVEDTVKQPVNQVDLLKRVSRLEELLYGNNE